jgi:hypothetical protein
MSHTARAFSLVLLLPAVVLAAEKNTGLPKYSPFEQRGGPAAPAAAANETIEFAGVSSIGQKTDLIFYDKTAKKSHWIAKGETKEGISVLTYDERRDEVVVKVNGVQKTLPLRKTSGPVGSARAVVSAPGGFNTAAVTPLPAPVPAQIPVPSGTATTTTTGPATTPLQTGTPPPAPGSPAEVQARQETEARMLVSDLLEIGMAQRRAYEEAQRKAAEGNTQTPNTADPAAAPAPPAPPPRQ